MSTKTLVLALILAAGAPAPAVLAQSRTIEVEITGFAFTPARIEAHVGDTITITNHDFVPHTLTSDDATLDSGDLGYQKSGQITLKTIGEFAFHCRYHPGMKGVISVREAK